MLKKLSINCGILVCTWIFWIYPVFAQHGGNFPMLFKEHTQLQEFSIPSIEECQNTHAYEYFKNIEQHTPELLEDQGYLALSAMWDGLCIKIRQRRITTLSGMIAFDNMMKLIDASRFLDERLEIPNKEH